MKLAAKSKSLGQFTTGKSSGAFGYASDSRKMNQEHEGNDERHKNAYRRQPHPPHLFPIEWESLQHGEPSEEHGTLFSHEKGSGRNQRKRGLKSEPQ
jgi:hypothetical protein